ncbi:MAG: ion transporter [Bacteroidota bacterium]
MLGRFFLSERNMMAAIVINAIVIFLLYFPSWHSNVVLDLLDHGFIFLFLLEALVKIRHLGWKKYIQSAWNRFDFVLVVLSLPSIFIHFFPSIDASSLLLLRLFRLVRLVRFISFIPHLDEILAGLGRAIRSSVFVLLALFFLNFMLAIFTCHFYGALAPELFGDPVQSLYSIFQMFTVEGWNEIPSTIAENMRASAEGTTYASEWIMRLYFVLIVLIGGIFGMSLANAVFVDEMTIDNNRVLEGEVRELRAEVRELKEILLKHQE